MKDTTHHETLLKLARDSIAHGLEHGHPLPVAIENQPQELQICAASFVTLRLEDELRGCIGTLEALRPLAVDITANAWAAAFRDPRFWPVSRAEFERLDIHISILSAPEPMSFVSEADLIAQLRPGIDGLIIEEGHRRGTFLPAVWESLPESADFLRQLKHKAGLPADYWSQALRVQRYTTESVG